MPISDRTYSDHIKWCKSRALADLPGDPKAATYSFLSDLNKHDETKPILQGWAGTYGISLAKSGTAAEVREFFGEVVFDTVIPRDVSASEAPSHGRTVLDYAPRSRAARAYVELCMEVLDRE